MNLPGRSAATLPALERVGTDCQFFLFPHVCLVRIVQDDDLRRPEVAEWSGSPWGELAAKQTEGGGVRTGNWELQWKTDRNDRFFESISPSHPLRGVPGGEPPVYRLSHHFQGCFSNYPHRCQVSNSFRKRSESFSSCTCLTSPHRIRGAPPDKFTFKLTFDLYDRTAPPSPSAPPPRTSGRLFRGARILWIETFATCTFSQSASQVP